MHFLSFAFGKNKIAQKITLKSLENSLNKGAFPNGPVMCFLRNWYLLMSEICISMEMTEVCIFISTVAQPAKN